MNDDDDDDDLRPVQLHLKNIAQSTKGVYFKGKESSLSQGRGTCPPSELVPFLADASQLSPYPVELLLLQSILFQQ